MHKQKLRGLPFYRILGECHTNGKQQYATRRDARLARRRMLTLGDHMEPYRCRFCNLWHVGHPD